MSEKHLIERSWEVFERAMRKQGTPVDEVSFTGGFMTCYGMLTGRIPIGLPPGYGVQEAFDQIQKELEAMRSTAIGVYNEEYRNGG